MGLSVSDEISELEVKAIRWVEHILAPLIVASVLGLSAFSFQISKSMAQLEKEHDHALEKGADLRRTVEHIHNVQREMIESQHTIELTIERVETHQEHFREEIEELGEQNNEILRILRSVTQEDRVRPD